MDALEFAKEHDRMCKIYRESPTGGICLGCPISCKCVCDDWTQTVPIIEKWSKKHPFIRNVDHVAMLLEKAGFEVDKVKIATLICPPKFSEYFGKGVSCKGIECDECRKWWHEEYKGE